MESSASRGVSRHPVTLECSATSGALRHAVAKDTEADLQAVERQSYKRQ
jgi:hypothetical protein